MQVSYIALAVSLAVTSGHALADEQIEQDSIERVVVVSSRIEMPIRQLATSVSVVSKEDIEARGYTNLAEVLRTQPAISVSSSGGLGSPTSLRVRGEEGYRTLVRLDGVDISDPTGTQVQPQFSDLQSANISRVEILRGTQGLAYGADAGGVINIQSGQYDGATAGSLSVENGRYNTQNIVADVGGETGQTQYYLSVTDFSTDGFNSQLADNETADRDGYDNTTLHAKVGYQINEKFSIGLVARKSDGDGEFDGCGFGATFSNDCTSSFQQQNHRANLNYSAASGEHELAYARTFVERESFNQGQPGFMTKGNLERVEYLGHSALNHNSKLVYGFDWEKESITSENQSRTQKGYYLEYQSEVQDNLFVTAGVRHDDNEDFGEHTSYRVSSAYLWAVENGEVKFRGSYGTGFRAPSLFEVGYNRGPFAFEPASLIALTEESTKGYEAGIEYNDNQGSRYELVYFNQKIEDSIFFDLTTSSGYLQDLGTSRSEGLELIADLVVTDHFGINANYTYNDARDTSGTQRIRRPRHLTNIGVYYHIEKLKVSATVRMVKDVVDSTTALSDYEVFDVSVRYLIDESTQVFARVENLFDTTYQDVSVFNTSGQAFHAGVKFQF